MKPRLYAIFSGRVQGVSFRYFCATKAAQLGVDGWVKNLPDGSVELVGEADKDRLECLLEACRQGPALARVDAVSVQWEDATGEFDGFDIRF